MSWWRDPTEHHAFYLSIASTIVTLVATIGGVVTFTFTGSSLMLSYGMENAVDLASDLVVLWRFYCPGAVDEATRKKLERRESKAT